jgi:2'-5' RNA ligase
MNEKHEKFRAFFAVDLSPEIRQEAVKLIKNLARQKNLQHIKWTKPENLHITMRFLGNISYEQFAKIVDQVGQAIKAITPFTITFADLIIFPSKHKPIAIALKPDPIAPLIKLNQIIEKSLIDCDIQPENRAFLPHLTLGKIKIRRAPEVPSVGATGRSPISKLELNVNNIILFRSQTGMDGSIYTPLICIPIHF